MYERNSKNANMVFWGEVGEKHIFKAAVGKLD